ncbi:MAG: NUDIX domain-containing protein [Candidatus Margulisbacteria bacterium]|nr:NUDIX domain-containing protein [Candidatus Margulisiibacteriota bacterium]
MKVFGKVISDSLLKTVINKRQRYQAGAGLPPVDRFQREVERLAVRLEPQCFTEQLSIVDPQGEPTGHEAPRWFVHLMGLRHLAARVALFTGREMILQVRSGNRGTPGLLDLTAGGHVPAGRTPLETAYLELSDEIGLSGVNLVGGNLVPVGQTGVQVVEKPFDHTVNAEINVLFAGRLKQKALPKIRIDYQEVENLSLQTAEELRALANSPLASSSLCFCLPIYLENLQHFMSRK